VEELPVPLIVKETGCGFGPAALARLRASGVALVDVAGAGGTTWTGVEALRGSARQRALGETRREWGIPTAAALL
jgi:isopentenyl-diphosphate delta-isomerase